MPTVERDISIGETGDVSIGDLHNQLICGAIWKADKLITAIASRLSYEGAQWVCSKQALPWVHASWC
jgi:hypothetical protein